MNIVETQHNGNSKRLAVELYVGFLSFGSVHKLSKT